MSTNYYLGDLHLGHANVINWRPQFKTVEEHDDHILAKLSIVKPRDCLYLMGDIAFSRPSLYALEKRLVELGCRVQVCLGNHDTEGRTRKWWEFDYPHFAMKKIPDYWLTHAPIHPAELRGRANIHGHVHDKSIDDPNYINVSCEAVDYTPISIDAVRARHKQQLEEAQSHIDGNRRQTWTCTIGNVDGVEIPNGGDAPMRRAVEQAFKAVTGEEHDACFSGWGDRFTLQQLSVISGNK